MTRGRKPDSNNVRKMKGEKNKERFRIEASIDGLTEIPEAPDFLTARGVKKFNELCGYLIAHNVLTTLDLDQLAFVVDLYIQITGLRANSMPVPMNMYTTWKSLASDLYLNPMARQKMMGGAEPKKTNKFEKKSIK